MHSDSYEAVNASEAAAPRRSARSGRVPIAFEDVVIEYSTKAGSVTACGPIDMVIEGGTFAAIVGPTGCGKSTLLNSVAGFVPPRRGRVLVGDDVVTSPGRDRGVVFQQYALFPWLNALSNVEFGLKGQGTSRDERRARAQDALERLHLGSAGALYPRELSGGMQQRVAIARMLAAGPAVMLMDEPFGALDAQTRVAMQELLLEVWESEQRTVLFVTHDIDEALLLADTIYVMSEAPGRIKRTLQVPLSRPRETDIQFSREYIDAKRVVTNDLRRPSATQSLNQ